MSHATLAEIVESGIKLTPMMEQYYNIKKQYQDHLLLFRMGDFYEVFFEDAQVSSKVLNITLTHRGKLGDIPIPMAGIPHHAANAYIDRLTGAGLKVAICEQVQDPKEAQGIVRRAVTQVVSPGIPYDMDRASTNEEKFICAVGIEGEKFYLATIEFSTGEFFGAVFKDKNALIDRIRLLGPKELLTFKDQWSHWPEFLNMMESMGVVKSYLAPEYFEEKHSGIYLSKILPSYKRDKTLNKEAPIFGPMCALSYYLKSTQLQESFQHIKPFRLESDQSFMKASTPTLMGLEILPRHHDQYKDSVLGFMDRTLTAMGSRTLTRMISAPLRDIETIRNRQDLIEYFIENTELHAEIREALNEIRDLDRILAKLATNKATSGDLLNICHAVEMSDKILRLIKNVNFQVLSTPDTKLFSSLEKLANEIKATLNDEIGASLDKGNLIKSGVNKTRDRLSKLANSAEDELVQLEERYRKETGINNLKVKSNNVAGFFIEVSKSHTNKMTKKFERKQTLVNAERYVTEELAEFEKEMISAKEKLSKLEREIFQSLVTKTLELCSDIQELSSFIGSLDAYQSLAQRCRQEEFSRPEIVDYQICHLKGAWHPLIRSTLKGQFVPHDLQLDQETFFGLITGPNMAGKTTVMREVAIIQVLAQVGCFVPAKKAILGSCDFLFSRLGASDDILRGQSTFMVEMTETAEILRHATSQSLIILDEVGRGTSTYDGLSIAWSLVEYFIANVKGLTLFATHYHELIEVAQTLKGAKNLTVETINHQGDVQFMYRLIEEGASQSFGLYVAKLAGLPQELLKRAEHLLLELENEEESTPKKKKGKTTKECHQLSLFPEQPAPEIPSYLKKIEKDLNALDIMHLTPIEAMQKLYDLKRVLELKHLQ
ncbi:MAG: DNA mismatch repair protein MutS [Bacteriovoracaceae bacterium]